ncbi:hypothetical protein [Kitasatospora sp. MAP5-34]|uniref:hypothetical protein n=1 Tax=Kitasatospora sp. MAP5-34 TaxID=3035102 RepID=UPI0024757CB6|nr:hypothetical protein [Kitasatospora sp. MAP5-34]MDH6577211.1 hypothetical protein [Kitasatospora sp. MAP5-34]
MTITTPDRPAAHTRAATLDDLYPATAWDLPVNPGLPAPRLPAPPEERRNLTGYRDHYRPFILREIPVDGQIERLAAIDKAFPHSLYDLMLLVARDDVLRTHVGNTPDAVLAALLTAARAFHDFAHDPAAQRRFGLAGSQLGVGWNYDPTIDRDNGQWWDKRFHLHLNCWTAPVCATVQAVRLAEITDTTTRRSLIDPAAHLAHRVMADALGGTKLPAGCRVLAPDLGRDADLGLPVGLKLRLPGWPFLTTAPCRALLRALHSTAAATHRSLFTAFTGSADTPEPWRRPHLLPPGAVRDNVTALPWLSTGTRADLLHLRSALKDVTDRQMRLFAERPWVANRCLTLGGLSYNTAFFTPHPVDSTTPDGDLHLVMQFKLVSYIGSSPAVAGAVASVIDRVHGPVMTPGDRRRRAAFQHAFLDTLTHQSPAST